MRGSHGPGESGLFWKWPGLWWWSTLHERMSRVYSKHLRIFKDHTFQTHQTAVVFSSLWPCFPKQWWPTWHLQATPHPSTAVAAPYVIGKVSSTVHPLMVRKGLCSQWLYSPWTSFQSSGYGLDLEDFPLLFLSEPLTLISSVSKNQRRPECYDSSLREEIYCFGKNHPLTRHLHRSVPEW